MWCPFVDSVRVPWYTFISVKKIVTEAFDVAGYRGGAGHWSYIFHRLTGVGVLLFLIVHVMDTALIGWGPEVFNRVMAWYRHPFFRVSEILLFAAVLYHTLNGVRIIVMDFWPGATRNHRRLTWATWALFVLLMVPVTAIMVHHAFSGLRP